jgi:tetratricopeptide (TPR) repeat protein
VYGARIMLPLLLVLLSAQPATVAPAPTAPAPAMDAAYVAFTEELEDGINSGDGSALDAHVDLERLIERCTRNTSAPSNFAEGFAKGMRRSGVNMGKQLVEARDEESDFHLLRLRMDGGTPHALYRVLSKAGINYLDFELSKNAKGQVVIVDIYPHISGELFSETLRRMYLMAAAEAGYNLMDKLMGKDQDFLKNFSKLQAMQRFTQEHKPAEVVKTFNELPPSLRQNKIFLLLRLTAASNLEEAEYQKAIAEFEKAFPNDASLALISIDGHMLRKDYAGVMKSIDRLDQRVKDPYLNYLRGSVMLEKEEGKEAHRFFQVAIDAEPTLVPPYWVLIGLSLQDKKYKDTALYLTAIERDAGVELSDLTQLEQYAGFVKSPEYKAWNKQRAARRQAAPAVP